MQKLCQKTAGKKQPFSTGAQFVWTVFFLLTRNLSAANCLFSLSCWMLPSDALFYLGPASGSSHTGKTWMMLTFGG